MSSCLVVRDAPADVQSKPAVFFDLWVEDELKSPPTQLSSEWLAMDPAEGIVQELYELELSQVVRVLEAALDVKTQLQGAAIASQHGDSWTEQDLELPDEDQHLADSVDNPTIEASVETLRRFESLYSTFAPIGRERAVNIAPFVDSEYPLE